MLKEPIPAPAESLKARLVHEFPWIVPVLAGSLLPLIIVLATGHTLAWRDTSQLFAPIRSLIADALRAGRLPLWNPYEATGIPLFAQLLHGVLHPWSLLAAFVSPADGTDLLIVLHVATGAVGAGVLARSLGASRGGAAVAGLGYGLSGYLLGMSAVIQYLAAGGSAPWAVAGLRQAARGGPARLAIGAVGMAVLFFSGDPQWAIVAALLGLLLACESNGVAGLGWAAAAVAAGTLLAGVQLFPTWEFLQVSNRGAGLSAQDRIQWAFAPARFVEFIIPGFFEGRPGPTPAPVFLWLGGKSDYPLPFLPSVFLGIPVLALAISGIRACRVSRLVGWAAILILWLSLGHFAGATGVLGWLPVWGSFRYAEKLIGPFSLCVSLLAALGLERFVAGLQPRTGRRLFALSLAAGLLAIFSYSLMALAPPPRFISGEVWVLLGQRLAPGLLLAAFGLAMMGGAARCRSGEDGGGSSKATKLVLAAVLITGLAGSAAALHVGARNSRARAPLAELRASGQVVRTVTPEQDIALPVYRGFDEFDALQAVRSRCGAGSYIVPSHLDNFLVYTGLLPQRFNDLVNALGTLGDARWIAFRRFAVTHFVFTPPLSPAAEEMVQTATSGGRLARYDTEWDIAAWEVPHRPWAWFADRAESVPGEAEAIEAVLRQEKTGDRAVVLQGQPPARLSPGEVLSIQRSPEEVRIEAESPGDGLLVVADAFWDGWEAVLDGRPVRIELADGMVRAVRWPAGRHNLKMSYRPAEVRVGSAVSGATIVFLAGLVGWERLRRRKG